ncbi:MAG: sugar phosphate isomerase/epimerase [Kiritimatiellae bacterium]|nr:sugar phosphate isomerase/epimerase [Kiritimatiellia bacterium]
MRRRDFLAGALACAAAPSFAAAPRRPRLGFQVYGVRDLCERDFPGTLRAARAIGYEGVETGRFYGRSARELKSICADAGLELFALQLYPWTLAGSELSKTIRFAHEAGCRRINVAWFQGSAVNENDWQLLVATLNYAAEVCAKENLVVAYHNHDHEFRIRFGKRTAWDLLWERFSPQIVCELDLGNCLLGGGDPLAALAKLPHRNPTVHVMPAIEDAAGLAPGEAGVGSSRDRMDWPRAVAALAADGCQWLTVKPTAHPGSIEDLRASHAYLSRVLSGI